MEDQNRKMDPEWKKNAKKLNPETTGKLPKELLAKISGGRGGDPVPLGDEYYYIELDRHCPFCDTKLWKLYTWRGEYEYTVCHYCGFIADD